MVGGGCGDDEDRAPWVTEKGKDRKNKAFPPLPVRATFRGTDEVRHIPIVTAHRRILLLIEFTAD